ncbi:tetraacyldisaccharide 4'-kinase [Flavobacterium algoritolerans]|uniref:Tetraacyldisaccharide 4'-kinase n=1 Tax=Flavobacterium algoritolerans TaxID=3041254 RepID=A0ABT6VCE5_9FLAO|nr:tetraacyldisaccharide 4'-kinase [Flavobacterium algoritolerans]MDI5895490.1 tetraacyldisaccharide 4'-kinase [Flavobacterium algoritolerans]
MNLLRKLLFPFAILYGLITSIRNFLFDKGILKSYSFDLPIIAVGNLSVGGTGKTPQIEYLIRLLSDKYKIATLSRGYKRQSKGFILAEASSNAAILGDEPFQFYKKFATIQVAVDADRKNGIEQLLSQQEKPEVILLDDAFQHRKVKAGFYILLTSYGDLYSDDFMLPTGNLRESRSGAKRANVIIVTKCPFNLSLEQQYDIKNRLKVSEDQELYFTFIAYEDFIYSENRKINVNEIQSAAKLLVAGIAKPEPFFAYLQDTNDVCLSFPDHHNFTDKDILEIKNLAQNNIIITTEKDYVRLKGSLPSEQLFYLPIQSSFVSGPDSEVSERGDNFDKTIIDYVGTSTRNGKSD